MANRQEIKLGYTFEYFIPGVLLIIIGGVVCIGNSFAGAPIGLSGIALLLLKAGIQINTKKRTVRKYYELFSLRFGSWIEVNQFANISLSMTNETRTVQHRAGQTTSTTKTYDLVLSGQAGSAIELNDFSNYDVAVRAMKLIAETFQLNPENKIQEAREAAMKRRKERR
ncbi:MAG: hypothetical protein ACJ77K_08540 [Bacteroidia bacterium]